MAGADEVDTIGDGAESAGVEIGLVGVEETVTVDD